MGSLRDFGLTRGNVVSKGFEITFIDMIEVKLSIRLFLFEQMRVFGIFNFTFTAILPWLFYKKNHRIE